MWIAAMGAIALAAVGFAFRLRKKKLSLAALDQRESLSNDEIYRRFYIGSGLSKEAVMDVWHEIARVLRVPAGHLRPTDRFGKDIASHWITSEELDVLGVVVQERANHQNLTIDLVSIETVDDYVRRLAPQS
jgi:hypothetical protein